MVRGAGCTAKAGLRSPLAMMPVVGAVIGMPAETPRHLIPPHSRTTSAFEDGATKRIKR